MKPKCHALKKTPKPQWQPEHWLMLWESFWQRLPWLVWAFAGLLLAAACLVHSVVSGDSPTAAMREWLSLTPWFLPR
jgi:hypothetical protein